MKKFRPQSGFVVQAYRFALDPNAAQEAASTFALWCGARGAQLGCRLGDRVLVAARPRRRTALPGRS